MISRLSWSWVELSLRVTYFFLSLGRAALCGDGARRCYIIDGDVEVSGFRRGRAGMSGCVGRVGDWGGGVASLLLVVLIHCFGGAGNHAGHE